MRETIELTEKNSEIDFSKYQLFGYETKDDKYEVFEHGFFIKINGKGYYCIMPIEKSRELYEKKNIDYEVDVTLLAYINEKYVLSDTIISVSSKQLKPLWIINKLSIDIIATNGKSNT